jgi:hypothetical protein
MIPPFFVSDYSEDLLSLVISKCFESEYADIKSKPQFKYLSRYLKDIGAETIVSERFYVDKDYSDDFSNYYVKGFKDLSKHCIRLHFFSRKFGHVNFEEALLKGSSKIYKWNEEVGQEEHVADLYSNEFNNAYLGFVVIKPLPFTFIGKTCLKPKPVYKNVLEREYKVNLFGVPLTINSVAFQEQDRVISACATTAVWSLLHALNGKHKINVPSPSSITLAAIGAETSQINGFPNKGLNTKQIIAALEKYRLKHHEWNFSNCDVRLDDKFSYICSYLDSDIPILAGLSLYVEDNETDCDNSKQKYSLNDITYNHEGEHAICIVGAEKRNEDYFLLIHDDRVGPFHEYKLVEEDFKGRRVLLLKSLLGSDLLQLNMLMVATYHKKRIHLPPIHNTCIELKEMMVRALELNLKEMEIIFQGYEETDSSEREELAESIQKLTEQKDYFSNLKFEIELLDCKQLKTGYFQSNDWNVKEQTLFTAFPHFIWRTRFKYKEQFLIDLLFDGTDMPNGNSFIQEVVLHDHGDTVIEVLKDITVEPDQKLVEQSNEGVTSYAANVVRNLQVKENNIFSILDKTYGTLRAPKYIKTQEIKNNKLVIQPEIIQAFTSLDVKDHCLVKHVSKYDTALWVIDKNGLLVIGGENTPSPKGHPTLTGSEPARIGGELSYESGQFVINSSSGRFSGQYEPKKRLKYLANAIVKFQEIFSKNNDLNFVIDQEHRSELELKAERIQCAG